MQLRRAVGFYGLFGVLLIAGVVLGVLVWYYPESLGMAAGSARQTLWFSVISATTFVLLAFQGGITCWGARWGARCIVGRMQMMYASLRKRPQTNPSIRRQRERSRRSKPVRVKNTAPSGAARPACSWSSANPNRSRPSPPT